MGGYEEMDAPEFHTLMIQDVIDNDGWAPESEPSGKKLAPAIARDYEED